MAIKLISVRNKDTGDVGTIREDWFNNPAINDDILERVEKDAKPYVTELYKSKLVEKGEDKEPVKEED